MVGPATWRALYDVYHSITGTVTIPPSNAEDYPGWPQRPGTTSDHVRLIQNYLNALAEIFPSIPKVTADGIFGPMTQQQVMAFQRLFGLTVDGIVGPSTWQSIIEQHRLLAAEAYPGVPLRIGSRGPEVQMIQRYLNVIGRNYPSIPRLTEDGIFGNGTAAAVREFQRIFGLAQDGVVGLNTWNTIMREYKKAAQVPTRTEAQHAEYNAPPFPGSLIKLGDRGDDVLVMQKYLAAIGPAYNMPKLAVDGIFGAKTQEMVAMFQALVGLTPHGAIDADTWKAISDTYWNLLGRDAMISAMGRVIAGRILTREER